LQLPRPLMHELALAEGILKIVTSEQQKNGFARVLEIGLSIGEYSGIVPTCLEECFPLVSKGTAAEGARLRMETVQAAFVCTDCDWSGPMPRHSACCPNCRSTAVRMVRGREFFVNNLVVE
ncbi:MAG: hydrogenase maturation nickel metallochaperone HypA, partial [Oscillospiraceae bacterium]|nr:hydrogenase maturation nickel metallochaperone HypA [Oscillospiraceae bacterium]